MVHALQAAHLEGTVVEVVVDLFPDPGGVVYAAIKWGDGWQPGFGVYGRDEQGAYFSSMARDWPRDRLRDFTVTGVVVQLLPDRDVAIAFARERGIDWKPARRTGE